MSDQQSIERQEREFTELLQRVMQAPLSPLTASVQELKERIDQLEQLVSDMREIELSGLTLGAEDNRKQIRSLKALSEETPREIQNVLQPLFEQFQAQLQQVGRNLAELNSVISAGQGAMESLQKQGFEYLENIQQTALAQLLTELENLRGEVGSQFARQLSQLRPMLNAQQEQLERQQVSSSERLGEQIAIILAGQDAIESSRKQNLDYLKNLQQAAFAQLLTKLESLRGEMGSQFAGQLSQLQPMLSAQQVQLERQHAASSEHLGAQMQNRLLSLRKWVIASVCMAAASLAGVLAIAAGRL